ncbi:hypothetical protein AB0L53_23120 [Nonomuraea sp. NPDC052129]|uniref:hypothetical protein n=1 Tax=Nonomuraea sp. NPDC052129 TaxID=3154651 RepID=UPI003438AE04
MANRLRQTITTRVSKLNQGGQPSKEALTKCMSEDAHRGNRSFIIPADPVGLHSGEAEGVAVTTARASNKLWQRGQLRARFVPARHVGRPKAVKAVANSVPDARWVVVYLCCPRDITAALIRIRADLAAGATERARRRGACPVG